MVSLTTLIGATCLLLGMQVGADPPMESQIVRDCIKSSGVPAEEIGKGPDSGASLEKMCFLKCLAEGMGMLSEEGDLNFDNIDNVPFRDDVPEDEKKEFIECASKVGKIEKCEDMAKVMACRQ
uniref:Odorant binding protein 23 n=1 Tax=Xylotrechus quadripes TaxID=554073 RepID=A0A346HGP5_9CUCU|nr:odorant binding protein 23 [Xylotrechus quadripes]